MVGGGIVGISVARRLLELRPGAELTLLEKEDHLAAHQTGHNSGVVHAGLYYAPGSLKAELCTRGRIMIHDFCQEKGITYTECGKLVVALNDGEVPGLRNIQDRATANKVPDLRWIGREEIAEIEPHARGVAALHSPRTAIVDYRLIAQALADDVVSRGGTVHLSSEVTDFVEEASAVRVISKTQEVVADLVVVCAGLQGDRIARLAGDSKDPVIVPFRGEYYRLKPERNELVRGLIYPVPDPAYPFLGVHFTPRVTGEVDIGPNAVLGLAREAYRRRDIRINDLRETIGWVGFRRLARKHWRMALREMHGSLSKQAFLKLAREYVPEVANSDVVRAPAGVRAQAVAADGALVDDFVVNRLGSIVMVRNAPSPAATSCLSIAEHLAELVLSEAS